MRKCGAKTRAGGKCQLNAGHGTDHIGSGKCKLHGGASKGAPKGNKNAVKHGIYSRIFSDAELDQAKAMQGSVETELAIARLQLMNLLELQKEYSDRPILDKVEESTIVTDDKEKEKKKLDGLKANFFKDLVRSAKNAGEYYDPDGDEDYIGEGENPSGTKESEVFTRKRTYQRRDFQNEFVRLTSLIARLEQQILQAAKTKAEIKIIEVTGNKSDDADDKLTDTELDQELQGFIGRFPI